MSSRKAWKPDIVIYHANCADGFGAAWAAWKKWGSSVRYLPSGYGQAALEVAGLDVLIVDFSYKRSVLEDMARYAASIVVLDHHKTAQAELAAFTIESSGEGKPWAGEASDMLGLLRDAGGPRVVAIFDIEKSGARLAWEFCHGAAELPEMLALIEDRDLWRFALDDTKAFALWLRAEPFKFARWETIRLQLDQPDERRQIVAEAKAMQRFYAQKIAELVGMARTMKIGGHMVPAVNCPPSFASEVGNELLDRYPAASFSACYSDQGDARGFSLRSDDGRLDVSVIASRYGGGGHRNAAGFGVPL